MKSSSRTTCHTTDRPSNPVHRLSEVVPRFQTLNFSSAVNQAKTEDRRGQLLEQLIKQRYEGQIAEENISFIRDSFTSFNDKIKELHKGTGVRAGSKKWGKDLVFENGTNSEVDDEMEAKVDDVEYGDNNSNGGTVFSRLTTQEEEDDEEHWRKTVTALPQHTTITSYYVEMGYQMAPASREGKSEEHSPQLPLGENSIQAKPKAKKWVPRMSTNRRPATRLPKNINSKFNNAQLYNTEPFTNTRIIRNTSKTEVSSPLSRPRFGPKLPPRCSSCLMMRKLCDRKSPCGRCSAMREVKQCVPYWRDV
ncbi:2cbd070a-8f88-4ea4-bd5c-c94f803482bd [Sclerotinia trifoliorum]|uniref:2cbd070a-8f88-4ea4-bd5c-c94f803482bd n=1 Tax=Sclerotinia trifoliorum TaxID=28548 RepID=A0A8H2VLA0_9HELO|nr:2cbd070a-8f88-4ea4-bd5c-c94f803482bd [Sclerotinia trifoliorum]